MPVDGTVLWWVGGASLVVFVGGLVLLPVLAVRIPEDYFVRPARDSAAWRARRPVAWWALVAGKNAVGAVLVLAGIAMLVLPGQGIATIILGLLLMDFPGKYRLERRLVRRPRVLRAINALRRRAGRPPLRAPG